MDNEILFPRTVYKGNKEGNLVWVNKDHRISYDSLLVNNREEYDTALDMGWIDSLEDALFPKEPVAEKKPSRGDETKIPEDVGF